MTLRRQIAMMARIKSPAVLVLLLGALAAGVASALQSHTNVIQGLVRSAGGSPLANVLVVLKRITGDPVEQQITGPDGRYAFPNLAKNNYLITAEPPKPFLPQTRPVDILAGLGEVLRVDFHLEQAASASKGISVSPLFVQEVPPQADAAYKQAHAHLREGKKEEALQELQRAVEIFPDYFAALNQLGLEYMQRGAAEEAEGWFQQAVEVNRNSASALFGLGWVHYQKQELEQAVERLRKSEQNNPRIADTHFFLGLTLLELKRPLEAEDPFRAVVELKRADQRPIVYLYLASIYDQQTRYAEAVDALKSYLKLLPAQKRSAKLRDLLKRLERKKKQASS